MIPSSFRLVLASLLLSSSAGHAQRPDAGVANAYEPVFEQLRGLAPRGDRVAEVHDFVLQRDAIHFHLEQGHLYLLSPVAGRTFGRDGGTSRRSVWARASLVRITPRTTSS